MGRSVWKAPAWKSRGSDMAIRGCFVFGQSQMTGRDLFPESHEEVWGSEGAAADVGSKRARAGGQGLGAERECEASVSRRGCLQPYCWVAVEAGQGGKAGWTECSEQRGHRADGNWAMCAVLALQAELV